MFYRHCYNVNCFLTFIYHLILCFVSILWVYKENAVRFFILLMSLFLFLNSLNMLLSAGESQNISDNFRVLKFYSCFYSMKLTCRLISVCLNYVESIQSLTFKSIDIFFYSFIFFSFGIFFLGIHVDLGSVGSDFIYISQFYLKNQINCFLKSNMLLTFYKYISLKKICQFSVNE